MISVENVSGQTRLAKLKGVLTAEQLISCNPFLINYKEEVYAKYKAERRRYEVLAEQLLLHKLFCNDDEKQRLTPATHRCGVELGHRASGSPYLSNGMNISISHTKGCIAVIVSPNSMVSIDVEYISERVNRITEKFLREDEEAPTLLKKLLHWCAKETLYKLYSDDNLTFTDMRLLSIKGDNESGTIIAENMKRHERVGLFYHIADDIVMTYCEI